MKARRKPVLLTFPGNESLASRMIDELDGESGALELHRFPDNETRIRIDSDVAERDVILVCSLDNPDEKLVSLYLTACTLRALKARSILLVAPYLPYMRQDKSFSQGEGISAIYIAKWLSSFLDGLVTVDPHLHRIHALRDIYSLEARTVHAAPAIAAWIQKNICNPVLVGPDMESEQWVADVARDISCPYIIFDKKRLGDRDVTLHQRTEAKYVDHTPVILDDIISSARTMIAAVQHLKKSGYKDPCCIGVHALFAPSAYEQLLLAAPHAIVTCNTISHQSNGIDLGHLMALKANEVLSNMALI